ncbi:4Fe-4S binding protein [Clostridium sp. P21]|uniref:4Fe-4S binding protein n=1 Tax=Clostridium muellerianum TaxID=2716538 RepID=A0A7Y0HRK3_9CLOT|nr:4Fe-4S binding protein [Clostridium muellerianum]
MLFVLIKYYIKNNRRICPQQCVDKGLPYFIKQANCLHCGLCLENCPVKAIKYAK